MVKHLVVALTVSVLLTACGGSDNKKKSSSSSSVAVSSKAASVAASVVASSAASSVVASSAASSVVVSSAASSVVVSSSSSSMAPVSSSSSSMAPVSSSSSSMAPVSSSSSSVASSSSSVASSSSSSEGNEVACEGNPDSVIDTCDMSMWVVDGGNGGSFVKGELGPIFTNGAPSGTQSYNKPGMFYVLKDAEVNKVVVGKTFTLVLEVDQALMDTGGDIQPVIQENGGSYGGYWSCPNNPNSGMTPGQDQTISCTNSGPAPKDGIAELRLGFQLNNAKNYLGTIKIKDATWE